MVYDRVLENMIEIYKPGKYDWMGYEIIKGNQLTYHHIVEKRNKGLTVIENGALLTQEAHIMLNKLEKFYPELYEEYNYMFQIINDMKCPITFEIRSIMKVLKLRMENALRTKSKHVKKFIR